MSADGKKVFGFILFIVAGLAIGAFSAVFPGSIYFWAVLLLMPAAFMLMGLKIQLIDLIIICLPVMFYKVIGVEMNISYADFLIPFISIPILKEVFINGLKGDKKTYKIILVYGLGLLAAFSVSLINIFTNDKTNIIYGASNIMKICVNVFYALVFLFYLTQRSDFDARFLKVWSYTAVAFAILCIFGSVAYAFGLTTPFAFYYRARGTFQDANLAACYLNMSLGIVLAYNYLNYKKLVRFNTFLVIFALFLTASRGGILSLALGLVAVIAMGFKRKIAGSLAKMAGAIVISLCIAYVIANSMGYNIINNVDNRLLTIGEDDYNTMERVMLWDTAFRLGMSSPWIGVGTGQFIPMGSLINVAITKIPHNTYLGLFAETGILGLAAFLWLPGFLAFKLYRRIKEGYDIPLLLALSMICVGVQAYSINMENYRILWIGYALLLYYCYKPDPALISEGRVDCHV